jgi:hypothetical protein
MVQHAMLSQMLTIDQFVTIVPPSPRDCPSRRAELDRDPANRDRLSARDGTG